MAEIIVNGPAGRIEARYHHNTAKKDAPLALILHPNPEHGGTMNNRVSFEMFQAMVARGFNVMRFNFRGVGKSQGTHDRGEGELSDAVSCLEWMQAINPNAPYAVVAGFSFGAWIGMQLLMRRPEVRGFISVAPPANTHDFLFLAPCPQSGLIIHGDKDQIVPVEAVDKLVQKLQMQKGITIDHRIVPDANHFFHDKTDILMSNIHDHMNASAFGGDMVQVSAPAIAAVAKKKKAA